MGLLNVFAQPPEAISETVRNFLTGLYDPSELTDGGACYRKALNDTVVFDRLVRVCLGFAKRGGWPRRRDFARQCSR